MTRLRIFLFRFLCGKCCGCDKAPVLCVYEAMRRKP